MQTPLVLDRLRGALSQSYTIDRELGKGGMATVYLAQDTKHDRLVALKVLHPDLAASLGPERFLREIKLAAKLNHPHILGLHDSGEADGFLYYVMPYIEGESLRERLDRTQQFGIDEVIHHGRAIASALDYAHRQGIVHRDIKPENVMLYEGEAMVMDFGIAKALSSAGPETLTQTGMMIGTPAYVSPEQAAGETNLDGKSDQYSLACVIYEMLSGERPFSGATPQAVMAKRFSEMPKSLRSIRSSIPESVEKAVTKAMAIDPSPTADATRLMLPPRTSPTANTPGRLVSRRYGALGSGQRAATKSSSERSGPVLIKFFPSSATQPLSQRVAGTAPVMRKTCLMSRASMFPVSSRQRMCSR